MVLDSLRMWDSHGSFWYRYASVIRAGLHDHKFDRGEDQMDAFNLQDGLRYKPAKLTNGTTIIATKI